MSNRDELSARRSRLSRTKRALLLAWSRKEGQAPAGPQATNRRSERRPAILSSDMGPANLNMTQSLFQRALNRLGADPATRAIPSKLEDPIYDRAFGEWICDLMQRMCDKRNHSFDQAVQDLVDLSDEFLNLQIDLDATESYACKSFEEARQEVYDSPDVMEKTYLNGLLLSQAFWINHFKILRYFKEEFCANTADEGDVLEVPVGTGIYIAEFMRENPSWNASAYDLSASSVAFSRDLLDLVGLNKVIVAQKNVFDISKGEKYTKLICGELLEHLENPEDLLERLRILLREDGKLFLTTAIWAAAADHIYLFKSAQEVRHMLNKFFAIESELVLNVFDAKPEDEKTPINYACILNPKHND